MTKIRVRRLLKNRLAELYPNEVAAAIEDRTNRKGFSLRLSDKEQKLVDILRSKIGYSCKTNNLDIFNSFIRFIKK